MNLERKNLAHYLPYKLECFAMGMTVEGAEYDDNPKPIKYEIVGLNAKFVEVHEAGRITTDYFVYTDVFPILRPLSDLVKIIKVNGKAFIPIMVVFGGENYREYSYTIDLSERPILGKRIEISVEDLGSPCVTFFLNNVLNNLLTYHNWQLLLEWHFDVFGLIEQGIAIDINTLKS